MIRFLLFLLFVVFSFAGFSQRYTFLTYSTAQGLPQSQVTSIAQDDRGYLWVGTLGGLSKFNGKDFETFTTDDGLLNNRITFITFIHGDLWIGHEGGVSKMTKNGVKKWAFELDERKTKVSDILEFKGQIIVASNGAGLFKVVGEKLSSVGLINQEYLRIRDLEVNHGVLFAGTGSGLLHSQDLKNFTVIENTEGLSFSSIRKRKNELFATTFKDGLYKINSNNQEIYRIDASDSLNTLRFCFFDSNDRLWLNTYQGIWRLNQGEVELKLKESNGLPMESIQTMFEDKDGNIWFGSEGKGLMRFTGERFVYYNESSGLQSDLILSVNQDRNGVFWYGTYDKGLINMAPNGDITNFQFDNNTIWASMMDVDGKNWFGTGSGLVAMKGSKKLGVYYYEDGTPGDKITAFLKLNSTTFYVGGSEGVSKYSNGKFQRLKGNQIETVRNFCKIGRKIYCATDKGLYLIQGDKLVLVGSFMSTIYSLASDHLGRLWIGTEEGLFIYEDQKIRNYSFSTNPASNFINFLVFANNQLYVGTNNGLFVLSSMEKKDPDIVKYGIGEGVVNLETNLNSGFADKKGHLWFGTASGLVCFRPNKELGVESPPKLVLKNILLNYQKVDFTAYTEEFDQDGFPLSLELPYSKNNISFELDGIALANYPGLKFQYRLEGIENEWSPLNNNTNITYSALSAGTYIFHARSIDARGKISQEIRIPFVVKPAFYLTWWFISLCVILLALIVIGLFQIRLRREREANEKERLEFKSRLLSLEQRSLNASMNRHFIFNSLNSIQYFINTQDKLSANRFLTNFAKLIRKNLDSSEEGNMVTLAQELERLDLYLSLESMRFKDRFTYEIVCNPSIDQESVIIPAMILQPFVENSIIHGILPNEDQKGLITINIDQVDNEMTVCITDNGIGIEESKQGKTDMDGDHRSQGMEITSKRIELLNKLSDQKFEIIGPFQLEDEYRLIKGTRVILKIEQENLDDWN